jgi:hypothetical protein
LSLKLGFERPSLCCEATWHLQELRMSRIEQKLSSPMGGEYSLQGTVRGLSAPARNSISFGWTAHDVQLVGADNAVKGVLREVPRSTVRDSRRFAFLAANSQQENPLPSRVNTLDDAKAFVRKHMAEGQWQHAGHAASARMGTLSESQLFGSNGKAKGTQASMADTAFTSVDTAAVRTQTPPSLLRTDAEAQRHVRMEMGKPEPRNPSPPESAATAPDARSDGVAPVQAEPVPSQDAAKVTSASVRSATKLRRIPADQPRKAGDLTLILSVRGELLNEPDTSAATTAQIEKQRVTPTFGAWITALITATMVVLMALAFYLWGPRPSSGLAREAPFAATAPLNSTPALTGINLQKPDAALRSQPFEAQKNTTTASGGKSKRKGVSHCNVGAGSGDADAACPNAAQNSRAQGRESGPPPSATTSDVARVGRSDAPGDREKQSEAVELQ